MTEYDETLRQLREWRSGEQGYLADLRSGAKHVRAGEDRTDEQVANTEQRLARIESYIAAYEALSSPRTQTAARPPS